MLQAWDGTDCRLVVAPLVLVLVPMVQRSSAWGQGECEPTSAPCEPAMQAMMAMVMVRM